jgi:hypothetical protein
MIPSTRASRCFLNGGNMNNFRVIYRILKYLEKAMTVEETDFSPSQLKG